MSNDAFIYDAIRTPRGKGKPGGGLYEVKPIDLVTNLLEEMQSRHDLDTTQVFDDQEAQFYRENPLIAVLTPYLDHQRNFISGSTVGVVLLKDTAKVNAYLAIP